MGSKAGTHNPELNADEWDEFMVGIDIVDITRVAHSIERFGDHFLNRVFTGSEIEYARTKRRIAECLAGRFAAKEAFVKAYGAKPGWKEIEVLQRDGRPYIMFKGKTYPNVSISHERAYAVAVVVIDGNDRK